MCGGWGWGDSWRWWQFLTVESKCWKQSSELLAVRGDGCCLDPRSGSLAAAPPLGCEHQGVAECARPVGQGCGPEAGSLHVGQWEAQTGSLLGEPGSLSGAPRDLAECTATPPAPKTRGPQASSTTRGGGSPAASPARGGCWDS